MTYPWPLPIHKQKDQQSSALIRDRAPLLLLNSILATFFPRIQASYTPLFRCIKQANPADPPQTPTQTGRHSHREGRWGFSSVPGTLPGNAACSRFLIPNCPVHSSTY